MTVQEREELGLIEQSILKTVQDAESPYPPRRLLDNLRAEGFREELIRAAIWFLVDANRLAFDRQRQLVPVSLSPLDAS